MIDYCYVTRFSYVTQSELNFIEEINKFKKIEFCILNRNKLYNTYYRILVNLSFKIESYLQEKFHISRNYLKERLVKIDTSTNFDNANSVIIHQWVFMSNTGFVFSDNILVTESIVSSE